MRLMRADIDLKGNFLLGLDRRNNYHGAFCWSAEQIATLIYDWRVPPKEERLVTKKLIELDINLKSDREPQLIHGIGASLIGQQFARLQDVSEIVDPRTKINLAQGRIYFRSEPKEHRPREANLLFYITPEGNATLAHLRTRDQAQELLWQDWIDPNGRLLIEQTAQTLPEWDEARLHPTYVEGEIVSKLITADVIYHSFFPEDPIARN